MIYIFTTSMEEIRKPVIGYEWYYEVSNLWSVKSIKRLCRLVSRNWKECTRSVGGGTKKVLSGWYWLYKTVRLSRAGDDVTIGIHRIVICSFTNTPLDEGRVVNHINGDPADNSLENLEFVTHQENLLHWHRVIVPKRREERVKNFVLPTNVL